MKNLHKIKNIIVLSIFILIFSIISIFHGVINPFIERVLFYNFNIVNAKDSLVVHFVSVGQGDAVVITLPSGENMLIDTGPQRNNVDYTNYLDDRVLNGYFDKDIDYLIMTHADLDHIGGTLRLLHNYNVRNLYMPRVAPEGQKVYYDELKEYLDENVEYFYLDAGDITIEDCFIKIFDGYETASTNESSSVIRVEYLGKSFLFTGDINSTREKDLIRAYGDELQSNVLKVSHHGSKESSTAEFLGCVSPEYAVISVGAENIYGHPTNDVLLRLDNVGSEVLRTDKDGNIVFVVNNNIGIGHLEGYYTVSYMNLDVRILILIVNVVLVVNLAIVIVPKRTLKNKR